MKRLYTVTLLFYCFLVGMMCGTAMIIKYERSTFQAWKWDDLPIIANCYGDDFNQLYIDKAVKYWNEQGHQFAYIEQNPPESVCKHNTLDGFIILKKKNLNYGTLAVTERKLSFGKKIRAATIYFSPGTYRLVNIINHELGHALGFGHVELEGHLMHPDYQKMGDKFWVP